MKKALHAPVVTLQEAIAASYVAQCQQGGKYINRATAISANRKLENQAIYSNTVLDESSYVKTNYDIMLDILNKHIQNLDSGIDQHALNEAEKIINYYNFLTIKLLKEIALSGFEQAVLKIMSCDEITEYNQYGIIASIIDSYNRGMQRKDIENTIRDARGHIGVVGERITINNAKVLRSSYSDKYGIYFITCINDNNNAFFFAHHLKYEYNEIVDITGNVKAHRDNTTQLNYVRVTTVKQENNNDIG